MKSPDEVVTMTKIIKVDPEHPGRDALEAAATVLRHGGLVAFPTETVYGLGADALNPEALSRIYAAKGRPTTNPLIVHVASIDEARGLAKVWSPLADRLARHFWPGPLTLVVPRGDRVPSQISAGMDTVALRIPQHPVALALLETSGLAIAAPSANRYMELSPTRAEHVQKSLGDRVDMILDGGPTQVGIESTVVSLLGEHSLILRPGMIDEDQLSQIVPGIRRGGPEILTDDAPRPSPGLALRHYAPRARLVVIKGSREEFEAALKNTPLGARKGTLVLRGQPLTGKEMLACRELPDDPQGYAQGLYGALHDLDALEVDVIYLQGPPDEPEWAAIWDRLDRAAAKD